MSLVHPGIVIIAAVESGISFCAMKQLCGLLHVNGWLLGDK